MIPEDPNNQLPPRIGATLGLIGAAIITIGFIVDTIGEGIELSENFEETRLKGDQSRDSSYILNKYTKNWIV